MDATTRAVNALEFKTRLPAKLKKLPATDLTLFKAMVALFSEQFLKTGDREPQIQITHALTKDIFEDCRCEDVCAALGRLRRTTVTIKGVEDVAFGLKKPIPMHVGHLFDLVEEFYVNSESLCGKRFVIAVTLPEYIVKTALDRRKLYMDAVIKRIEIELEIAS